MNFVDATDFLLVYSKAAARWLRRARGWVEAKRGVAVRVGAGCADDGGTAPEHVRQVASSPLQSTMYSLPQPHAIARWSLAYRGQENNQRRSAGARILEPDTRYGVACC